MEVKPLRGKALTASQNSTARINIYEGSVRSGKTIGTLIDWIRFCRTGPDGNLLMTGRTERTVINNLVLPIQDMLGTSRVKINRGNGTVDICGRTVLLIGANNEQARTKIQGLTLAGAYVDEVSTLPESYFNMLTSRLSVRGAMLLATCNPEGPRHWLKIGWLDRAKYWVDHSGNVTDLRDKYRALSPDDPDRPLDLHRFSFQLDDNAHNLDPEYLTATKGMYSGLWYQRMILGQWSLADGIVYEMFNPDIHVVSDLPKIEWLVSMGVDHGVTNPTAGILLGIGNGTLYAVREWAPKGQTDADRSASMKAFVADAGSPSYVFVDPAAAGFRAQLISDGWSNIYKANNNVLGGIGLVASLLSQGKLKIHESCTNLLNELPNYVWDSKSSDKGEDAPVKLNDHWTDSLRYAVTSSRQFWSAHLNVKEDANAAA